MAEPIAWQGKVVHAQSANLTFDGITFAMPQMSNALCLHVGT
ncbi:MAG: hypothetical protein ABIP94_07300 [Planctomycetota bacterium]